MDDLPGEDVLGTFSLLFVGDPLFALIAVAALGEL